MNNSWSNLPTDIYKDTNADNYLEKLAEPLPEPPKPDIETKLVDIATEVEKPKAYINPEKKYEKPKELSPVSEPVNIYEPGFRTDMYAAMVKYFREKKREKENVQKLREKLGLRG